MTIARRDFFDQPLYNAGSETIPPFAVCELKSPGLISFAGKEWFTVGKPTEAGKIHFINGPFPIPASGTNRTAGGAYPHKAPGAHALFKPDMDPETNNELGPIAGQWYLGEGNGFLVLGDIVGSPASLPGFPTVASTKRVRVIATDAAAETDRIQGTVAMTVSPTTLVFPIVDILVLSGKDPRPEPVSPVQAIIVNNTLRKAYVNGVDRVTATRNKTTGQWNVETDPGGGGAVIRGTLRTDLTSLMASVVGNVLGFSGENPADNSGGVTIRNVVDGIRPVIIPNQTRYQFASNAGANFTAAKMTDGLWYIVTLQNPVRPPVAPET